MGSLAFVPHKEDAPRRCNPEPTRRVAVEPRRTATSLIHRHRAGPEGLRSARIRRGAPVARLRTRHAGQRVAGRGAANRSAITPAVWTAKAPRSGAGTALLARASRRSLFPAAHVWRPPCRIQGWQPREVAARGAREGRPHELSMPRGRRGRRRRKGTGPKGDWRGPSRSAVGSSAGRPLPATVREGGQIPRRGEPP